MVGLEVAAQRGFPFARGAKVGVLTHQCACDSHGVHLIDHLRRAGIELRVVFSPEHGLWSTHQAMEGVEHGQDPIFGIQAISLYRRDVRSLTPAAHLMAGLDVLIIDLQDIGTRYYTYAATMVNVMRVASEQKVKVVVLDRPNPINGVDVEGGLVDPGFNSFVGQLPVPQRHGMTLGELAQVARHAEGLDLDLEVVEVDGWNRETFFDELPLLWIPPSPNMPTVDTALVYPGMCLLEGTNVSEGRGTTTPFELFGAPFIDPDKLQARVVEEAPCRGFVLTKAAFRPQFGKWAGEVCKGLRVHVTDRRAFKPLAFGLTLVKWMYHLFPGKFQWRTEEYEFVTGIPAVDLLLGGSRYREALENGAGVAEVMESMESTRKGSLPGGTDDAG